MLLNTLVTNETLIIGSIAWWDEIASHGTPFVMNNIDCQDSVDLVFLWRDPQGNETTSPLQAVYIDVNCVTDHHSFSPPSLSRIIGTDVWYWQMTIERDWCGSYSFIPVVEADLPPHSHSKQQQRRWWRAISARKIADPFNQPSPKHGTWWRQHSAIHLEASRQQAWANLDTLNDEKLSGVNRLRTFDWQSSLLGNCRHIWLLETTAETLASPHDRPSETAHNRPLVILLDGEVWSTALPISHALEAASRSGSLQPSVYLFIDSIDPDTRAHELPCNPEFWLAVQRELLPKVQTLAAFSAQAVIIAGQSYGGLSALYAALHWPDIFNKVLSLSGSFWWPNVDVFQRLNTRGTPSKNNIELNDINDNNCDALDTVQGLWIQGLLDSQQHRLPLDLYLEAGSKELGIYQVNQQLYTYLTHLGYPVTYRVYNGGHDKLCWRSGLIDGLQHFIGAKPHPNR